MKWEPEIKVVAIGTNIIRYQWPPQWAIDKHNELIELKKQETEALRKEDV